MKDPLAVAPTAYQIRPLDEPKWDEFVLGNPRSSVFHTRAWLHALRQTYGYEAIAFTTSPPGTLPQNAVVFCLVDSWLTGRRLVSLPFADHCEPLVSKLADEHAISAAIDRELEKDCLKYVEFRPTSALRLNTSLYRSERQYCHHQVDLRPHLSTIFNNCHKDSIQRKIRRAEREGVTYEEGRSEPLLLAFYRLWLVTRRRHCAPPQAMSWFRNLIRSFGEAAKIRIASKEGQPVAAIITLCHRDTLMYKYGCSDSHFHNLGGMHLLLWNSIQEAKAAGLETLDLGRSDLEGAGLITFKDRWGASRSELTYSRVVLSAKSRSAYSFATNRWSKTIVGSVISRLPDRLLRSVGELLYPHIG